MMRLWELQIINCSSFRLGQVHRINFILTKKIEIDLKWAVVGVETYRVQHRH